MWIKFVHKNHILICLLGGENMDSFSGAQYNTYRPVYYKHSGKMTPLGVIYMLLFGIIGAIVLSLIYCYATIYIPFVYINFLLTLCYGGAVGLIVAIGAKKGKIRNIKLLIGIAIIIGVFAEYTNWVSWIYVFTKHKVFTLSLVKIKSLIELMAVTGVWSIKGSVVKGASLYIIWVVEAAIIIGASAYGAFAHLKSVPFCEDCNEWVNKKRKISFREPILNQFDARMRLERMDYEPITSLKPVGIDSKAYTEIELRDCPICNQKHYITVKSIIINEISKGRKKKETKKVVNMVAENLIVDSESFSNIKSALQI